MIAPLYSEKQEDEKILPTQLPALFLRNLDENQSGRFIVADAIEKLIKETPCAWIVLSYSSGGRATKKELSEVINDNGKLIETSKVDYQRNVMSTMKWTNEWVKENEEPNREFLFLIQRK